MSLKHFIKSWIWHDAQTRQQNQTLLRQQETLFYKIKEVEGSVLEFHRKTYLQDKVLHCNEKGVSSEPLCAEEVVVSLTSYGDRVKEVYLAIESIMQGTVKPNRIVLWLPEKMRPMDLPIPLQLQQKRGLQVEYCEDLRSYTKIIPSLKLYPGASIITIDDDVMYEFDLVENLVRTHKQRPDVVCANRIHKIVLDLTKRPVSYLDWDMCSLDYSDSKLNFLTGVGGVLYPPRVFVDVFFDVDAIKALAPLADDVWINAMLLKAGVPIVKSFTHAADGCDYGELHHPLEHALSSANLDSVNCRNDVQIKAVFEKFDLYSKLVE